MGSTSRWPRIALLLAWILFIWAHSLVPADASTEESDLIARFVAPILARLGVHDWDTTTFLVRKTAHFLEYMVLGLLSDNALRPAWGEGAQGGAIALAVAAAVPCIDEVIQLFVQGRSGQLSDVLLDMCGAALGLALAWRIRNART